MAHEITLTMEGLLLNWLKDVGDQVSTGDVIAEVEADKATLEVESTADGVILELRGEPGDNLSEGAIIAIVGAAGEASAEAPKAAPAEAAPAAEESAPAAAAEEARDDVDDTSSVTEDGRIKASPVARKIAQEKGINLSQVRGTGPDGRIIKADVENFKPSAAPAAAAEVAPAAGLASAAPARKLPAEGPNVEHIDVTTMRKRIAAGTTESWQYIPHFYVTTEVDVAALLNLRKQLNSSLPEDAAKITVNDMVVKATALTLREYPNLNSHYYGDKIVRYKDINVGIAVAPPDGGVIYVVAQNADKVALGTMAANNRAMAGRAREGKLKPDDLRGATFSTSNMGGFGVDQFIAIINPPESGVLAFGTAKQVPVVLEDGTLGIGSRMKVTISVDHRISDGAEGAAFLQTFKTYVENPLRLLV
jgi:pyruvate dehydrogenase E2 component (dihydrolipoamide acetyltransferase)